MTQALQSVQYTAQNTVKTVSEARNSPNCLGLDFSVNKLALTGNAQPVEAYDLDMNPIEGACKGGISIPDFVAVEAKGRVFHCPSSSYTPLQPKGWYHNLLDVIESVGVSVESIQARSIGGFVFLDVTLERFELKRPADRKKGDVVAIGIRCADSINGKMSFVLTDFEFRLWCTNGCSKMHKGDISYKYRHSKNIEVNVDKAIKAFQAQILALESVKRRFQGWADAEVSPLERTTIVDTILQFDETEKNPKKTVNVRDRIQELAVTGRGNSGQSLWDIFNGVTEYTTHEANTRGAKTTEDISNARFLSANGIKGKDLAGRAALVLDKALEVGPFNITI